MKDTCMYGLFEKQDGRWVRLAPTPAFRKKIAVSVFQNMLLSAVFSGGPERRLRVVKD